MYVQLIHSFIQQITLDWASDEDRKKNCNIDSPPPLS